ncbi:hypothetical protein KVR01_007326 [Diaporthe batatas]|uniref:uncharacterized protein n=1 Tax=Diaporthe batatas TaxID=748121 RepID=UPI001D045338|nr:uncharacterized protein KVR01_007326 [Diaporthe batatas]KAG8162848.1 hypothetical protein KVR01_007326 [Diaporthe batatas]
MDGEPRHQGALAHRRSFVPGVLSPTFRRHPSILSGFAGPVPLGLIIKSLLVVSLTLTPSTWCDQPPLVISRQPVSQSISQSVIQSASRQSASRSVGQSVSRQSSVGQRQSVSQSGLRGGPRCSKQATMCDQSNANTICGIPMEQIRAGVDAGDNFLVPFCHMELTAILVSARDFGIHPDNITQNLEYPANVATTAAQSGSLHRALTQTASPVQDYLLSQYTQLVVTVVDFAYLHGAIVYRNGGYSWDEKTLPRWTHRPAAAEQWLKSKGCPIGDHHFMGPANWLVTFMLPDPSGMRRLPAAGLGPLSGRIRQRISDLVEYLDKAHSGGDGVAVKKSVRALRRLVSR